ncbi:MAG: adenylosuccinate synthetase [Nanoarchaeota archaeon]
MVHIPGTIVTGALYGDEGKGKVTDVLTAESDIVVKWNGGANAGTTYVIDGKQTILHLLPAGVMRGQRCLLASDMVINAEGLEDEINQVGGNLNLGIDPRAHVVLPYHISQDLAMEMKRQKFTGVKIGTTAQGIGPCYEDAHSRIGVRMCELTGNPDSLEKRLRENYQLKKGILEKVYGFDMMVPKGRKFGAELVKLDEQEFVDNTKRLGQFLKQYVTDVSREVRESLPTKNILFQTSQGVLLDRTFGNYPMVTSSRPFPGGVFTSLGLPPQVFNSFGIVKAYLSKVGSGPVPTCLDAGQWPVNESMSSELGKLIRKRGYEVGATTGRQRRVGWLDLVALKHSCDISGFTQLALTKLDTLADIGDLDICVAYYDPSQSHYDGSLEMQVDTVNGCTVTSRKGSKITTYYKDWDFDYLWNVKPVYSEVKGFSEQDVRKAKTFEELPEGAREYIKTIEDYVGIPITLISTGPDRNDVILRNFRAF